MITPTALVTDRYLAAIEAAILEAVQGAARVHHGAAAAIVRNRKGESSLYAQAARGQSVRLYDLQGRNTTAVVLSALREWHRGRGI